MIFSPDSFFWQYITIMIHRSFLPFDLIHWDLILQRQFRFPKMPCYSAGICVEFGRFRYLGVSENAEVAQRNYSVNFRT